MAETISLAEEVDGLVGDFSDMCHTIKNAVLMAEKAAAENRLLKAQVEVLLSWLDGHPFCPAKAHCTDYLSCEECYAVSSRKEAEGRIDAETTNNG